jgi:hypothetical protein
MGVETMSLDGQGLLARERNAGYHASGANPSTDALDAPVLAEVQDELFRGSVRATHVDAGGEKLSAAGYLGVEWNR